MSRGLGKTQRAALAVLKAAEQTADRPHFAVVDSITVAARAVGRNTVTVSEATAYRRALRTLAARGLVVDMGRHLRYGRRGWATPPAAQAAINDMLRDGFWRVMDDFADLQARADAALSASG